MSAPEVLKSIQEPLGAEFSARAENSVAAWEPSRTARDQVWRFSLRKENCRLVHANFVNVQKFLHVWENGFASCAKRLSEQTIAAGLFARTNKSIQWMGNRGFSAGSGGYCLSADRSRRPIVITQ
jgi:hypothetical protein